MSDSVLARIVEIVVSKGRGLDPAALVAETRIDAIDVDDLEALEILIEIEDQFVIHIFDAEVEELATLADLADLVDLKVAAGGGVLL